MLSIKYEALIVIDIQGNLAHAMHEKLILFENVQKIIKGFHIFEIPIIMTEQSPAKLGPTMPEISGLLSHGEVIGKDSFSCCGSELFMNRLNSLHRFQTLLAGIETHVCVYQTAIDLIKLGYEVHVIVDAVSSRTSGNRKIGIEKMHDAGAIMTSTETALFEMLQTAADSRFREISRLVK
jgi:nicotinamidase-related amidase